MVGCWRWIICWPTKTVFEVLYLSSKFWIIFDLFCRAENVASYGGVYKYKYTLTKDKLTIGEVWDAFKAVKCKGVLANSRFFVVGKFKKLKLFIWFDSSASLLRQKGVFEEWSREGWNFCSLRRVFANSRRQIWTNRRDSHSIFPCCAQSKRRIHHKRVLKTSRNDDMGWTNQKRLG